jgi:hypothetical protein
MITMAQLLKVQYEKIGAVFANGDLANDERISFRSSEFQDSVIQSNNNALANGILLEPLYYVWAQDTFTLDVCKLTTSLDDYNATKTFSSVESLADSALAGWTYLGTLVIDV